VIEGLLGPLTGSQKPTCGDRPGSEPFGVVKLPEQLTIISAPALTISAGFNIRMFRVSSFVQAVLEILQISCFTPPVVMVAVVAGFVAE
jgi:hypothetical protein